MDKKMDALKYIFRFLLFTIFFLFVLGEFLLPKELVYEVHCEPFDVPWTLIREDGSTSQITIPGEYDIARNEKVYVETILPNDMEENWYLCFRSNRQDMEIYVDGQLRERYTTIQTRPYGHSSAGALVFMKIEKNDAGKQLLVSYQTDSAYSGKFSDIYYGDSMGIWMSLFKERGAELAVALLMLLLGIFSVLGSLILRFYYHKPIELEYLGWGVFLAACWMLSNAGFRQLCFSNISIVNDLAFVMVMILPYPFLIYLNEIQRRRYNLCYIIVCSLVAIDTVFWITLQVLNLVDFSDSIVVFAGVCGVSMLLMAVTMIIDFMKGYISQYRLVSIGILGASLAAVAQFIVYFMRVSFGSSIMMAYGLIFLLLISSINTVREILSIIKERQQAILANKSKAQFLANMSHEIRTPINAVLGMDEMILQESTQQNIIEYAMDIQSAGKNLLALINDILDFSKIESGKLEIVPVEYDLSSLIVDCYNMVSMRAKEKQLEFIVENDNKLPAKLYGDEVRIRQVMVNLLTNAVKYTKEGSVKLSIQGHRLDIDKELLQISVFDTGIGITQENIVKLFNSFQRVDEKRNRNIEGTGLGLAITKQLLDLMGGSISVESEFGKGSVFRVEIPQTIIKDCPIGEFRERMNPVAQVEKQEESLIAPEGKILVVDDVYMNLKVFVGLLKHTQLQIDMATSGQQALALVEKKKYDIIFLDHMMPELDGIETFRIMKTMDSSLNVDTPVIMLTANAIVGVREEYLQEGFSDYLSKPVQGSALKEMVKKYLPKEYVLKSQIITKCKQEEWDTQVEQDEFEQMDDGTVFDKLSRLDFLDTATGLIYCGNTQDFYCDVIKTFLESDNEEVLEDCYIKQDWSNYQIYVHGLKSTSLSIGAKEFSAQAKAMEQALKDNDVDFVLRNHADLMKNYVRILREMKQCF